MLRQGIGMNFIPICETCDCPIIGKLIFAVDTYDRTYIRMLCESCAKREAEEELGELTAKDPDYRIAQKIRGEWKSYASV